MWIPPTKTLAYGIAPRSGVYVFLTTTLEIWLGDAVCVIRHCTSVRTTYHRGEGKMSKKPRPKRNAHKNQMTLRQFIDVTTETWDTYLQTIARASFELADGGSLLYPNIALFVQTNEYYILELFGSNEAFTGLTVKTHREPDIYKYLYQFPVKEEFKPVFATEDNITNAGMIGFVVSGSQTIEKFENRFQFLQYYKQGMTMRGRDMTGPLFRFGVGLQNFYLSRCTLLNSLDNAYRAKYINHLEIVSPSFNIREYRTALEKRLFQLTSNSINSLFGVQYVKDINHRSQLLSGHFANMFLIPNVRETTIGEFLKANPHIINKAFDCHRFVYEPYLEWIEGNERYPDINPDLMIEREDGFFDIVDLKTIKDESNSITKGPHKRRRFIDYVGEGIAQLGHYREYFTYEKNRSHAFSKYGIKVDNPKLILVVGSYDNVHAEEVREACRMYKEELEIRDYDTLNTSYLLNSQSFNAH